MKPTDDLPPELVSGPFRAEAAERYGIGPDRLQSTDFVSYLRDVYVARDIAKQPFVRHAAALALIPRGILSHDSALEVWQLPLPSLRSGMPRRIHVTVPPGTQVPRIAGIMTHEANLDPCDVVTRERELAPGRQPVRLPVTVPARALLEVAASWTMDDVVAAADAAVGARRLDRAAVEDVLRRNRGRRGVTTLRAALPLIDGRAANAAESRMRMLLVTSGLPLPRCRMDLFDGRGDWVATATLAWPPFRTVVVLDPSRPMSDQAQREETRRRNRLAAGGWAVLGFSERDLRERPHDVVAQVWGTLRDRGWTPPSGAPPQGPGARPRGAAGLPGRRGYSRHVA